MARPPQTLPADFFSGQAQSPKAAGDAGKPPATLPAEFFNDKEAAPGKPDKAEPEDALHRFVGGLWDVVSSPLTAGKHYLIDPTADAVAAIKAGDYKGALAHFGDAVDPGGRLGGDMVRGMVDQGKQAVQSAKEGEYIQAAGHGLAAILPGVGPAAVHAGERIGSGDVAGGLGETAGLLAPFAAPEVLRKVPSIPISPKLTPALDAEGQSAVRFADANDIPITAATRSGRPGLAKIQAAAGNGAGGGTIAKAAKANTTAALQKTAAELADRVSPVPNTPENAGAAVQQGLGDLSKEQASGASSAYSRLEEIESDPQHLKSIPTGSRKIDTGLVDAQGNPITRDEPITKDIALPVDMRDAKKALQPVYDRLKQEMPLAQQQSSRGLQAIQNVLGQDDFVPASVADQNLSALKQLQREVVHPKTKFLAGQAVNAVAPAVDEAVAGAGPEAVAALRDGRSLTKAKFATDATIDQLKTEPVKLFNQLTSQKDTSINLVRDVAKKAPDSMPTVGRAFLEGLMDSATSAEGKPGPGTAYSQWAKLGDETKKVLFPNPVVRQNINDFFKLAKMEGENPNPSGTAYVNAGNYIVQHPVLGGLYVIKNNMVARMLYDPAKAKVLMDGLRTPAAKANAVTSPAGRVIQMAGRYVKPFQPAQLPAAADSKEQPPQTDVASSAPAAQPSRSITIRAGDGSLHVFPDEQAAAAFEDLAKKAGGASGRE